jgi:BRCA1-associated protein
MPSYFYHLKFELYPSPTPDTNSTTTGSAEREEREIWVPPPGTDIFDSSSWPRHKPVTKEEAEDSRHLPRRANEDLRKSSTQGEADRLSTGAVIDCGPSRATTSDHDTAPLVRVPTKQKPNFSALAPRDQRTAIKDWRFGRVRVEGVDMLPTAESPSSRPARAAEAEGRQDGINAGLATGASGGRVTKAEFRALEGKNTEVGWGIVHLYRDGEETPGLGSGVDVYQALEGGGNAEVAGDKGEREDCTTLCIPAVPSYLTPSDFLGFVGEKTREEVSHFRMVMTGRMNRYLVLMKFRDNAVARKWRAEWDGKVFNDMEVSYATPPDISHQAYSSPSRKPVT